MKADIMYWNFKEKSINIRGIALSLILVERRTSRVSALLVAIDNVFTAEREIWRS